MFPVSEKRRVYDGPVTLDPIPEPVEEAETGGKKKGNSSAKGKEGSGKPKAKAKRNRIRLIVGLIALAIASTAVAWVFYSRFGPGGDLAADTPLVTQESTRDP